VANQRLIVERLANHHDRSKFDCSVQALNIYLQKYSSQRQRKGVSRTYVATEDTAERVLGYYTISAGGVDFDTVPENLPRHPIPIALIGRLAVDICAREQGLGETLLIHAMVSAQRVADIAGVYAVVVDALDPQAKSFYLKYGFKELLDDHLHLYLPMKTINKLKL